MTTYYKFLTADNKGPYSNFDFTPYLPKRDKPGKWLPKLDSIEMCERGYHVCTLEKIDEWANANLYIVEVRGEKVEGNNKAVFEQMRLVRRVDGWNERNLRHAAADIVEQTALPAWKKDHPDDTQMEDVIAIVRRYADGEATDEELAAARDAARDATWDAAWDAARDATRTAAWDATRTAAWDAARTAARDAARTAARDAAWAAARDAAWAAARDAAWAIIYKRCGLEQP